MKTNIVISITAFIFAFPFNFFEPGHPGLPSASSKKYLVKDMANNPQIDRIIYDEMVKQNIPGVAVGVIRDGNIIHTKGYGYSNLENKTRITENTRFRWASISKTLTAVATLQMVEAGKIRLSNKVYRTVDNWPQSDKKDGVSIQHLLMNRSGINHYGDGKTEDGIYKYYTSRYARGNDGFNGEKAVDVFKDADLDFTPGTDYLYSTFGFNLLGAVLDVKSETGYVNYVKEFIAEKADMQTLAVSTSTRSGFQKSCDGRLNSKSIGSVEWKLPGGGWESNIIDLAKFARGIMNGDFLTDTDKLWSIKSRGSNFYHYGIKKSGSDNSLRVWHGGAHDNLRTLLHLYPNRKEGIVIMCNANYADCWRILDRIYNNVLGINRTFDASPADACKSVMDDCGTKFAGIWRKTNKDVILRRGYSHKAFLMEWEFLKSRGYYCDDFEVYTKSKQLLWDGVFKKGNKKQAMWRNFDQSGFNKKWKAQTAKGYRLVDLETYLVNGKRKWAGLFLEGNGKHALFRNLNHDDFYKKHEAQAAEGRRLIDVEVHGHQGKLYWSGVWAEGSKTLLNRNYTTDNFNKLWKERSAAGYRLIDVETYVVNGQQKWTGIWEKSNQPGKLNRNQKFCNLMDKHEQYSKQGYELIDFEAY